MLRAAVDSGEFDSVWVSTDHKDIAAQSRKWGAKVHIRGVEVSKDTSTSLETMQVSIVISSIKQDKRFFSFSGGRRRIIAPCSRN